MQGVFRSRLCPLTGGQGPFLSEAQSPCLLHRGHLVGGGAQGLTGLRSDPGRKSILQAVASVSPPCLRSLSLPHLPSDPGPFLPGPGLLGAPVHGGSTLSGQHVVLAGPLTLPGREKMLQGLQGRCPSPLSLLSCATTKSP